MPEVEHTPKGPRTHDVRRDLSELQAEHTRLSELYKKQSLALKTKEKQVKKLEVDNQHLEAELSAAQAKLLDMQQPPEATTGLKSKLSAAERDLANALAEVAQKSQEIESLRDEWSRQLAAKDRLIAALTGDFQTQLAAKEKEVMMKDKELAATQEAARQAEAEMKARVEREMERLCAVLAQSSQKLAALQSHLQHDSCFCKELVRQEDSSKSVAEMLAGLRDDVLSVKFELEGLHKLFSEMQEGRGFQVTAFMNRTLVLRANDSFCLQQCIDGVGDIKRLLQRTKELVAQIYTDRDA